MKEQGTRLYRLALALALGFLVCSAEGLYAQGAGDDDAGKAVYETLCTSCHGAGGEGNKVLTAPAIAGQEGWYIIRQLQNFKAGVRGTHAEDIAGQQMRAIATTLTSEADLVNVAAYVSSLKGATIEHDGGGDAAAGQALFAICAACHGSAGEGMEALNGPRLDLQQDWYLIRQLQSFRAGHRGTDAKDTYGVQMKPMADALANEQAVKDVVAFITSLNK